MKLGIFTSLLLIASVQSSRILVVYPSISKSHIIPLQVLSVDMADEGHNITFVTTYPLGKKVKNYREILIPFEEADKEFLAKVVSGEGSGSLLSTIAPVLTLSERVMNDALKSKDVKKLMDDESFDLVIVGFSFLSDALFGIGDHFKCPSILFSPAGIMGLFNQITGNPFAVDGAPHLILSDKRMGFVGRLKTFFATGLELVMTEYWKYRSRQIYNLNFPADRYRSYDESLRNISLVLVNSHFSSGIIRPLVPNVVEIGGIQIRSKIPNLPEDLRTFLAEAKDGVIVFSLGSNAKSTYLSEEVLQAILKVFSKLKQRVVMKWESNIMYGRPNNVFISKWLPQSDLLAHAKTLLFISHCGFGGLTEAKYHKVPIVGIPLFGDQPGNAAQIVEEGWGLSIDLATFTEAAFEKAVREVLLNPKYIETVTRLSDLARDRPLNPQSTALYWIEYVINYHGAPHLRYPGADLNLLQRNSIDIILFCIIVLYAACKILKFIVRKVCCSSARKLEAQNSVKKTNKKNN